MAAIGMELCLNEDEGIDKNPKMPRRVIRFGELRERVVFDGFKDPRKYRSGPWLLRAGCLKEGRIFFVLLVSRISNLVLGPRMMKEQVDWRRNRAIWICSYMATKAVTGRPDDCAVLSSASHKVARREWGGWLVE